jgi:hypothetical protein
MNRIVFFILFFASGIIYADNNCSNPKLSDFEKHWCLSQTYEQENNNKNQSYAPENSKIKINAYYSSGGNGSHSGDSKYGNNNR